MTGIDEADGDGDDGGNGGSRDDAPTAGAREYAEPDPRLDHDTIDLLYAQTDRYCSILADRGVLDGDATAAVDALFAAVDDADLRRRVVEVGAPYTVTLLVFRVLEREGVAVGHGTPTEGEWEYGRLVDRCAAVADGLDGLTCEVGAVDGVGRDGAGGDAGDEGGNGSGDRFRVAVALGDDRRAVAVRAGGGGAAVESVLELLNGYLDDGGVESRRFRAVPVADGVGVFLVEPGEAEALQSFFEIAGMMRRD